MTPRPGVAPFPATAFCAQMPEVVQLLLSSGQLASAVATIFIDLAASDAQFVHGLLEGIARIERESYDLLTQLGATPVTKVRLHVAATQACHLVVFRFLYKKTQGVVGWLRHCNSAWNVIYLQHTHAQGVQLLNPCQCGLHKCQLMML